MQASEDRNDQKLIKMFVLSLLYVVSYDCQTQDPPTPPPPHSTTFLLLSLFYPLLLLRSLRSLYEIKDSEEMSELKMEKQKAFYHMKGSAGIPSRLCAMAE